MSGIPPWPDRVTAACLAVCVCVCVCDRVCGSICALNQRNKSSSSQHSRGGHASKMILPNALGSVGSDWAGSLQRWGQCIVCVCACGGGSLGAQLPPIPTLPPNPPPTHPPKRQVANALSHTHTLNSEVGNASAASVQLPAAHNKVSDDMLAERHAGIICRDLWGFLTKTPCTSPPTALSNVSLLRADKLITSECWRPQWGSEDHAVSVKWWSELLNCEFLGHAWATWPSLWGSRKSGKVWKCDFFSVQKMDEKGCLCVTIFIVWRTIWWKE